MVEALIAVAAILLVNILGFSFWLGRLSQKVDALCNSVSHLRDEVSSLRDNDLMELNRRVSYIEGVIRRQNPDSETGEGE